MEKEHYLDWMKQRIGDISKLKFAIDCSNGMSSLLVRELFPKATIINGEIDGTFPNHSPNPLKAESRQAMAKKIVENNLDCGVIFDGDADRCVFLNENGAFVQPDYLIPIVAKATLQAGFASSQNGKPIIIHDVRTSRGAIEAIAKLGCEAKMVRVGHAFAKPALRDSGAICGGELAGHYYFAEFHNCDSGMLAAIRILNAFAEAKRAGLSFSKMMTPICDAYENSGELNFRVEDKDAAIARVLAVVKKELPPEIARSEMDGVRIEFEDGWLNIRKSNTEPFLRLIVERRQNVAAWVSRIGDVISSN